MSDQSKKILALVVAIVVGLGVFGILRTVLNDLLGNSSIVRIIVGAIAGGLGALTGSLLKTGIEKKLNVQGSGE